MVSIRHFNCRGPGSIPGGETEIPQAMWRSQNLKKFFSFFNLKKFKVQLDLRIKVFVMLSN